MKNNENQIKPGLLYLQLLTGIILYLFLPCLFAALVFTHWLPFQLSGKAFLVCYLVHMATGYLLLRLAAHIPSAPDKRLAVIFFCLTITIALARIVQGLYHHKPIFYLVLLTISNCLLLVFYSGHKRRYE